MCDKLRTSSWSNTCIGYQKNNSWHNWTCRTAVMSIPFSDNKKSSGRSISLFREEIQSFDIISALNLHSLIYD